MHDESGALERAIEPPYIGWLPAGIVGRPDEPLAAYAIQGAADPGSVWVVDLETGASTPFRPAANAFDPSGYVTRQVFYESGDGTEVHARANQVAFLFEALEIEPPAEW